jgi:type VI secretion system protein ImpF
MARIEPKRPLLPSVLDRLLDDAPEVTREPPTSSHQYLRDLRDAVRRDLENLLNTRKRLLAWPPRSEGERSALAYGVPDLTGRNFSSKQRRADFLRSVEDVLRRFEPRFKRVKVTPVESDEALERTLHFRIDALLHAEPAPEQVAFDSTMEPVTRTVHIKI